MIEEQFISLKNLVLFKNTNDVLPLIKLCGSSYLMLYILDPLKDNCLTYIKKFQNKASELKLSLIIICPEKKQLSDLANTNTLKKTFNTTILLADNQWQLAKYLGIITYHNLNNSNAYSLQRAGYKLDKGLRIIQKLNLQCMDQKNYKIKIEKPIHAPILILPDLLPKSTSSSINANCYNSNFQLNEYIEIIKSLIVTRFLPDFTRTYNVYNIEYENIHIQTIPPGIHQISYSNNLNCISNLFSAKIALHKTKIKYIEFNNDWISIDPGDLICSSPWLIEQIPEQSTWIQFNIKIKPNQNNIIDLP